MQVGDLVYPWFDDDKVGLVVDYISDQWSERFLVFMNGRIYEAPIIRNYKSDITMPKRVINENR